MCLYVRAGAQDPHTRACDIKSCFSAHWMQGILIFILQAQTYLKVTHRLSSSVGRRAVIHSDPSITQREEGGKPISESYHKAHHLRHVVIAVFTSPTCTGHGTVRKSLNICSAVESFCLRRQLLQQSTITKRTSHIFA